MCVRLPSSTPGFITDTSLLAPDRALRKEEGILKQSRAEREKKKKERKRGP